MSNDVEKTPEENSPANKRKPVSLVMISLVFLILCVIGLFFIIFRIYQAHHETVGHLQQMQMTFLQQQKTIVELQQEMQQVTQALKLQDQTLNGLRQSQSGYNREEWRVLEAEFLARLANDKLQLEKNPLQALTLLSVADEQIRDVNIANLLPVRKALLQDIETLKAIPVVDITGLYLRLAAINQQIDQLPFPNKIASALEVKPKDSQMLPWWKQGLAHTWQALQKIVIVRYSPNDKLPLVTPEQQTFIYQNLHAAIEKAMWALLHQQMDIYRSSLEQASHWINQYFAVNVPLSKSVLAELATLQQINIHPALPEHLESLQAFKDYIETQNRTVKGS